MPPPPRLDHEHELANAAEWQLDLPQGPPRPNTHRPAPHRPPAPILDEMPKIGATEKTVPSKRIAPPQNPRRSTHHPKPSESAPTAHRRPLHPSKAAEPAAIAPPRHLPHQRPKEELFQKVRPRDPRAEQRAEDRARKEAQEQQYTLPLPPPLELPFSLVFLWPDGPIGLDSLDRDANKTALDEMRRRHRCFIEFDNANNAIVCSTMTESDIFLLQQRLEGLYREIISKLDSANTINVINSPRSSIHKARVDLKPVSSSPADGGLPILTGDPPEASSKEALDQEAKESREANERLMCEATEIQLQELRLTRQHVRIRLNIGVMALKTYRRPLDGTVHTLQEFEEMMGEELTSMAIRRIAIGCYSKDHLHSTCLESGLFSDPEEIFSAKFDFVGNDRKVLRLEIEYKVSDIVTKEVEILNRRWLEMAEQGKQLNVLEMNVLDFSRYDTQLLITAVPFSTNMAIQKQLSSFESSIHFTTDPISADLSPKRRSQFTITSSNAPNEIEETSTTAYTITGTSLKFAVTRHDTFWPHKGGPAPPPPKSEWSFSIYDPAWDVMMGELSYLQPGENVSWSRTLETFFPGGNGGGGKAGFRVFAQWVEIVQDFLAESLVGDGKVAHVNSGNADGVAAGVNGRDKGKGKASPYGSSLSANATPNGRTGSGSGGRWRAY